MPKIWRVPIFAKMAPWVPKGPRCQMVSLGHLAPPPPPPPTPIVAPICCTTITQKGAAVASSQQCFFKAVEWGVVGPQWGLVEACMWALDLRLRATTADPCKSPSIMRGYHVPIARLQVGCAHVPSHFQEITRKSRGSKATHQQG